MSLQSDSLLPSEDIQEVANFLLDYATLLMGTGVHTSRADRNIRRIAASFGYEVNMMIFSKNLSISITSLVDPSVRRTYVKRTRSGGFNFRIISDLSALSWEAYDQKMPLAELREKYDRIVNRSRLNNFAVLFLVALANASFCRLFNGDLPAMGYVFVATLIAFYVRQRMTAIHLNHMFVWLVCSFLASAIAAGCSYIHPGETPQVAIATSVLFLIPGVPMINSILDILEGYVLMGTSRAINAILLIISISIGLSLTLLLFGYTSL